jgi:NADH-quinone oxidoreductase subunit M
MMLDEIPYGQTMPFPILSLLVALPLVVALAMRFLPDARRAYPVAIGGSLLHLALAATVVARFRRGTSALQFVEHVPLGGGLSWHLGVDGISVLFLPLLALLGVLVVLYAQQTDKPEPARYIATVMLLEASLMGAFVAVDLLLFWAFAALEIVPGSMLIRGWGTGAGKMAAARRYTALNLMGVLLVLAGAMLLSRAAQAGAEPFSLPALLAVHVPARDQALAYWLMMLGLAVRIPLFPFHGWLPPVVAEGPVVGVSVFLVGAKLGAYGVLRYVLPLLPEAAQRYGSTIALLGVAGMIYGALLALVQTSLRRLVAFACLSHMGTVLVGLSSMNLEGLTGALLVMLNVGLSAAGLYFVAGFLHSRLGSTDVERLGRLSQYAPMLALTFLVVGLSTIGMPGTSGFEAEHLVVVGALGANKGAMAVAVGLGSLLGAAYLLRYFQRAFLASSSSSPSATQTPPVGGRPRVADLRLRELVIAGAFGALIVGLGLFTRPLLDVVDGSLRAMTEKLEAAPTQMADQRLAR